MGLADFVDEIIEIQPTNGNFPFLYKMIFDFTLESTAQILS